jgi:hypothetical protein
MQSTLGPDVFIALATEMTRGRAIMQRRSETDKEYFLQDWFEQTLQRAGYELRIQGRNSTPDFIVAREEIAEGFELKSLAHQREERNPGFPPCRTDVDFNSSIPCGRFVKKKNHRLPTGTSVTDGTVLRSYYLFVLYEPLEPLAELQVQGISMVLTDGDFLNNDLELAESHVNVSQGGFGSYGDAFIRIRKMYRFPNPLTEPDFRYRVMLVTQDDELGSAWPGLQHIGSKEKVEVKTGKVCTFHTYELEP